MQRTIWKSLLILAAFLAACQPLGGENTTESVVDPVVVPTPPTGFDTSGVIASAVVVPVSDVQLSFPSLGMVTNVDVRVGEVVSSGQALAALDTVILEAQIAEAEANVVSAGTQVRYLRRVGSSAEQIDSAQADVDRAQAVVDQFKARLAQTTLVSPIDGTVISVDVAPGEVVNPGQIVFVIADLSALRIETTDLSERDIPAVQTGQTAKIFIEALNAGFEGRVNDIARQPETVGGDVVYRVTIEFNQQPEGLRWGMSAEVQIETGE